MSLAEQIPIGGKRPCPVTIDCSQARFRTFQICPKDLPVLLRQFACPAWGATGGWSASRAVAHVS
jgi:hypothetical protein